MLDHSGISHDAAKWCDVERFEQSTDNSPNSQETFVEGWKVYFLQLIGVSRGIPSSRLCTVSKSYNRKANIICGMHVIQCRPIEAWKVRCRYGLVNTQRVICKYTRI